MPSLNTRVLVQVNTRVFKRTCSITSVNTLADRLRHARTLAGLSQAALAKRIGQSQSAIGNLEAGSRQQSTKLVLIAAVLGVRAEWLMTGEEPMRMSGFSTRPIELVDLEKKMGRYDEDVVDMSEETVREINVEDLSYFRRIPVIGEARLGNNGDYLFIEASSGQDGFVRYPTKDSATYALRCKGDSMRPRIKPGEFVVVEPNHRVELGDEVAVRTLDGRQMIKVLALKRDGFIELHSINEDHKPITLEVHEIAQMHFVGGILKASQYYPD